MPPNQAQHSAGRKKSDLVNIRSLSAREPATSTGKVMWIWPEIEESLAAGKKLREVWEAVHADGLAIPYPQFRVYVSRVRSRKVRQPPTESAMKPHALKSTPLRNLNTSPTFRRTPITTFTTSGKRSSWTDSLTTRFPTITT